MSSATPQPLYVPRSLGQTLDQVYRLMRANLRLFVGIAIVPPAVMYFLIIALGIPILFPVLSALPRTPSPEEILHLVLLSVPVVIIVLVLNLVLFSIYLAAASFSAVQADCGVKVTFRESYAVAWKRAGRYCLLQLLIQIVCFGPALVLQLTIYGCAGLAAWHRIQPNPILIALFPLLSLLQIAATITGIVIWLRFALAFPASVFEDLS